MKRLELTPRTLDMLLGITYFLLGLVIGAVIGVLLGAKKLDREYVSPVKMTKNVVKKTQKGKFKPKYHDDMKAFRHERRNDLPSQ